MIYETQVERRDMSHPNFFGLPPMTQVELIRSATTVLELYEGEEPKSSDDLALQYKAKELLRQVFAHAASDSELTTHTACSVANGGSRTIEGLQAIQKALDNSSPNANEALRAWVCSPMGKINTDNWEILGRKVAEEIEQKTIDSFVGKIGWTCKCGAQNRGTENCWVCGSNLGQTVPTYVVNTPAGPCPICASKQTVYCTSDGNILCHDCRSESTRIDPTLYDRLCQSCLRKHHEACPICNLERHPINRGEKGGIVEWTCTNLHPTEWVVGNRDNCQCCGGEGRFMRERKPSSGPLTDFKIETLPLPIQHRDFYVDARNVNSPPKHQDCGLETSKTKTPDVATPSSSQGSSMPQGKSVLEMVEAIRQRRLAEKRAADEAAEKGGAE